MAQPDLSNLKSQLLISQVREKDNPLFQVVSRLIDATRQIQTDINASIVSLSASAPIHNLLNGNIHPDTILQSPTRGSLIYGNITPKWDELIIGAVNTVLKSNGNDPFWGLIVNANIDAAAAIDWSKISKTGSSLADLTTRSAGDLSSGTLPDARLSANVPLLNATNTFSQPQVISHETSSYIRFDDVTDGIAGYIGVSPHLITGGLTDALGIRGVSGIEFSGDNGTTKHVIISSGGLLTVFGHGIHAFDATGGTGGNVVRINNNTAGTTNFAGFTLGNDTGIGVAGFRLQASNFTDTGINIAGGFSIFGSGVGGCCIAATHADGVIRFISGGNDVRARILSSGNVELVKKITKYNDIAAEGYGIPAIVDLVELTNQSADIGATNFTNANVAGLYRVSAYLEVTTTDAGGGNLALTLAWTDDAQAESNSPITVSLRGIGGVFAQVTQFIRLASGNITYSTAVGGSYLTSKYALYMTCERLS